MKKKIISYFFLSIGLIAGWLINGFIGGFIFGIVLTIFVFSTIGQWQYKKAMARQEKLFTAILKTKIKKND